ncbi:Type-1 fimbrial protein, A chain precursor [compost metagenome]
MNTNLSTFKGPTSNLGNRYHKGNWNASSCLCSISVKCIALTFFLLALITASQAVLAANCEFQNGTSTTHSTVTLPDPLTVTRDHPAGTVLWDSGWVAGGTTTILCASQFIWKYGYTVPLPLVPGLAHVYDVGIPGIGVKAAWYHGAGAPPASIDGWIVLDSPPHVEVYPRTTMAFTPFGTLRLQFIATGDPITSGTRTFPNPIVQAEYGEVISNQMDFTRVSIVVESLSCETPDVYVPMGTHSRAQFTGIGSKVGLRPFNIAINNCPPGLNSISVTFRAPNGLVGSPTNGVLRLTPGSSAASGFGLQLLQSASGAPEVALPFDTKLLVPVVNVGLGGNFTLPLQAQYYQTETSNVSGGEANATAEFTMSYE